jgi:anti-sigma B factor antagonist
MDLSLITSEHDGVGVLSVEGEVDLATVPRFREGLLRFVAEQRTGPVVVDLDGVGTLDDTAVGVLIGARRRSHAAGGEVHLVVSDDRLLALLRASGLDMLFPIHATLSAAMGVIRVG